MLLALSVYLGLLTSPAFAGVSESILKIENPAGMLPTYLAWYQTAAGDYDPAQPAQKLCFATDVIQLSKAEQPGSQAHCLEIASFAKPGIAIQAGDYEIDLDIVGDKLTLNWFYIRLFKVKSKCTVNIQNGQLFKPQTSSPVTVTTVERWPLGIDTLRGFCSNF